MKSYEFYLQMFIDNVLLTRNTRYESRIAVHRHNKAVDKYRYAAKIINKYFPEKIESFCELLDSDNVEIRICCAVCIVELLSATSEQKQLAINQIKEEIEKGNAFPISGWKMWLKQYDI